jgi:hypothetical protein
VQFFFLWTKFMRQNGICDGTCHLSLSPYRSIIPRGYASTIHLFKCPNEKSLRTHKICQTGIQHKRKLTTWWVLNNPISNNGTLHTLILSRNIVLKESGLSLCDGTQGHIYHALLISSHIRIDWIRNIEKCIEEKNWC